MEAGDRLAQYSEYYRARAARYASNPLYPETAEAERQMAEMVAAATSFDEIQAKMVQLSVANGRALARDQAHARAKLFADTQETVRAQAPNEILGDLDEARDAAAIAALASHAETQSQAAVTADELHRQWTSDLVALENAEVWRTAQVPGRWRSQLAAFAQEGLAAAREAWTSVEAAGAQQQPGWQFSDATARESRHRRLVPLPDDLFERRLAGHRTEVRGGCPPTGSAG